MFKVPEKYRMKIKNDPYYSDITYGNNGKFFIPINKKDKLQCVASDGLGWNHVSVSLPHRTPTWKEMCLVKDSFWDESDCVLQFHPPKSAYVNNHPHVLHLWQPIGWLEIDQRIVLPPTILV